MSGKAPPRAPRALLGSLVPSAGSSSASQPSASRLGATPPTGPRSLTQRVNVPIQPPKAPKYVNGHSTHPSGSAGTVPPTGPSALRNKGKQLENSWSGSSPSGNPPSQAQLGAQVNGVGDLARNETAAPPTAPRSILAAAVQTSTPNKTLGLPPSAPTISFRLRRHRLL
ncbi:hypothetical protein PHLGIDRAFT_212719 [Phlebiopsis gigantea 11061_1 CR5-6]|uniref:Uncharacterized protein n=1 Tax=Phlebiopsis gigantea (strain 11061_1 CR5-6) TaxID=745531 RepID=A0A0C3PEV0_PHLG1|nr:hypothetical protein PHLGIDRAFT_212719 [Phlebiopsis gigantea 11061_1 CR5-6]